MASFCWSLCEAEATTEVRCGMDRQRMARELAGMAKELTAASEVSLDALIEADPWVEGMLRKLAADTCWLRKGVGLTRIEMSHERAAVCEGTRGCGQ